MSEDRFTIFEYVPCREGIAKVKDSMKRCGLKQMKSHKCGTLDGFYVIEGSGPASAASRFLTLRWDVSEWAKETP